MNESLLSFKMLTSDQGQCLNMFLKIECKTFMMNKLIFEFVVIKGSIQSCTCKILPHPNPSCSEPPTYRRDRLCVRIPLHEVSVLI